MMAILVVAIGAVFGTAHAGEIPDYYFQTMSSQVGVKALDSGDFLILAQDATSSIYLFEVASDEQVDTFSCPYDVGNVLNPSFDLHNGKAHLVWTTNKEGYGRYTNCDLANGEWSPLVTYNYDPEWATIDQAVITIDSENEIIYAAGVGWHSKLGSDRNVLGLRSTNNGRTWGNWRNHASIRSMLKDGYDWRQTLCISHTTEEVDQQMVSIGMDLQGNVHALWLDPRQDPEVGYDLYRDAWVASGDSLMFGYRNNLDVTHSHDVTQVKYATFEGQSCYVFSQAFSVWVYGAAAYKVAEPTSPVTHIGLDAYQRMSEQVCVWSTEAGEVWYSTGGYYGNWTSPELLDSGDSPNVAVFDTNFLIAYNGDYDLEFQVIDFE